MTSDCVSVSLINPVISHVKSMGFDTRTAISKAGINPDLLKDPDNRLPVSQVDALFNGLVSISNKMDLGLSAGASLEARSYNLLQHLLLCCSTLSEALVYLNRYFILFSDEAPPTFSRKGDGSVKISFPLAHSFTEEQRVRMDLVLSITCHWLRQVCGREFKLTQLLLPFSPPSYMASYERWLRAPVRFNCQEVSAVFPAFWLDKQLHQSNPHIMNMIKTEVKNLAEKINNRALLSDRIRQALTQNRIEFSATQKEVAELFHISSRTLNRHLQQEGTSLKSILTQSRIDEAKTMLEENKQSIEQIAMKIGFSGRRTLDRIFIKYVGMSPAQYRSKSATEGSREDSSEVA
ncbi:AraC family transcriptional regulator [Bermanella marisrubri]|nr:AraC family transcriptional regulator [Bermanella marisrubri]QIZ84538.1 AraC family transcriptional regulator [Bermanella marisrubri]